ncbi:hypothetical protein B566_EDAN008813 [Ephemera danica]|nr:hypothetical protein B566_EDAN008813 [Ephemera danica]
MLSQLVETYPRASRKMTKRKSKEPKMPNLHPENAVETVEDDGIVSRPPTPGSNIPELNQPEELPALEEEQIAQNVEPQAPLLEPPAQTEQEEEIILGSQLMPAVYEENVVYWGMCGVVVGKSPEGIQAVSQVTDMLVAPVLYEEVLNKQDMLVKSLKVEQVHVGTTTEVEVPVVTQNLPVSDEVPVVTQNLPVQASEEVPVVAQAPLPLTTVDTPQAIPTTSSSRLEKIAAYQKKRKAEKRKKQRMKENERLREIKQGKAVGKPPQCDTQSGSPKPSSSVTTSPTGNSLVKLSTPAPVPAPNPTPEAVPLSIPCSEPNTHSQVQVNPTPSTSTGSSTSPRTTGGFAARKTGAARVAFRGRGGRQEQGMGRGYRQERGSAWVGHRGRGVGRASPYPSAPPNPTVFGGMPPPPLMGQTFPQFANYMCLPRLPNHSQDCPCFGCWQLQFGIHQ